MKEDVLELETDEQKQANEFIEYLYKIAKNGDADARGLMSLIFDDSWESVVEKIEEEGSTHYVWYVDGLNQVIRMRGK